MGSSGSQVISRSSGSGPSSMFGNRMRSVQWPLASGVVRFVYRSTGTTSTPDESRIVLVHTFHFGGMAGSGSSASRRITGMSTGGDDHVTPSSSEYRQRMNPRVESTSQVPRVFLM